MGAWHQDGLADWLSDVMWLWLFVHCMKTFMHIGHGWVNGKSGGIKELHSRRDTRNQDQHFSEAVPIGFNRSLPTPNRS
jgi:hypothetical protein